MLQPIAPPIASRFQLTAVELRVAYLVANGLNAREIAAELGITVNTARCHVQHLLVKTSARNKAHFVTLLLTQSNFAATTFAKVGWSSSALRPLSIAHTV